MVILWRSRYSLPPHGMFAIHTIQSRVDSTVYEELLKVLLDAERNKLTPSEVIIHTQYLYMMASILCQIYFKVSEVLAPWPQLLNIFTDYLDCSEAIKADVVSCNCVVCHYLWYSMLLYV